MRIVIGALWLVLFLVLFAFAVNNTAITDLHFFAGMATKAPLIALLLAFFIAGFAFGFIALMPAWVRQRVELRRWRRSVGRPADTGPAASRTPGAAAFDANDADAMQGVARGARHTT